MQISRFVQTSRLNNAEAAVVKSTYPDNETPKIKHVKNLIDIIRSEMCSSGFVHQKKDEDYDVIRLLSKRVRSGNTNWQIILKTLSVTNTLLREADIEFTRELTRRPFLSGGQSFWDPDEPDISRFIQALAKYLQNKLQSFVDLDFSMDRKIGEGTKFLKQYSYKQLGWILPRVASQLESLARCQAISKSSFGLHPIIRGVLRELVKDGLRLYSAFTLSVFLVLEQFQKLSLSQQKWTAKMGHRYFKINSMFEKWCLELVNWGIIESKFLPKTWNSIPRSLVTALEEYIQEAENSSEESSSESESKKGRVKHEVRNLSELLGATALNFDPDDDTGFNFIDDVRNAPTESLFDVQSKEIKEDLFDPASSNLDELFNFSSEPTKQKAKPKPEAFDPLFGNFFEQKKVSKPPDGQADLFFDIDQGKQGFSFDAMAPAVSENVLQNQKPQDSASINFLSSKPKVPDPFAQSEELSLFDIPRGEPLFVHTNKKTESLFDPVAPNSAPLFSAQAPVHFSTTQNSAANQQELFFFDPQPQRDTVSNNLFDSGDFSFGQTNKKEISNKPPLDQNLFD